MCSSPIEKLPAQITSAACRFGSVAPTTSPATTSIASLTGFRGIRASGSPQDRHLWLTGYLPGSSAHVERLPGGVTLVLLFNRTAPVEELIPSLRAEIGKVSDWPDRDLFR